MIGIENAFPVGPDLSNIEKFYNMGGRYMSLAIMATTSSLIPIPERPMAFTGMAV